MMKTVLSSIQGYHAWANAELLAKLNEVDPVKNATALQTALRLLNHALVVARIFQGHLSGTAHGFQADNTPETPALGALAEALRATDAWYRGYLAQASEAGLSERIGFGFTDGDRGMMTRAEMVMHVILHAGYHRGEVGRILWGLGITPPWDTYAVHLHQAQPERRLAG